MKFNMQILISSFFAYRVLFVGRIEIDGTEWVRFVSQSMMSRRVKQYLSNLTIIQDEEKLRDMSHICEPAQGSGR